MIGIRVDANDIIAMGHLMRCMSIAQHFDNGNSEIKFIVSEQNAKIFVEEKGFECICLDNDYKSKDSEIEQMAGIFQKYEISQLLIDSYEVTPKYMEALKKYVKLIYIDDINKFRYPAEVIINYTYGTDMTLYKKWKYDTAKFCLGSKYVPLRQEFGKERIGIRQDIQSVFLTTGGTDQYGIIRNMLKEMQKTKLKDVQKNVVLGRFYKDREYLDEMAYSDESIKIYQNISNICDVMRKSDIAISAGGTTLAELCACGIPTVCFSVADNQLNGTKAYSADGLMVYAGDVRDNKKNIVNEIIHNVEKLAEDYDLRENMSRAAKEAIDGKGALRIAEIIRTCCPYH